MNATVTGAPEHARERYAPEPRERRHGTALCLSGGGFRAALFHLGAARRLNELGVLAEVTTISSVSGGSILSAHLAARIRDWPEPGTAAADWQRTVSDPFHAFVRQNLRTGPLLERLLPWNWPRSTAPIEALARRYAERLTDLGLAELPAEPRFVFCSTDLEFGVNWVFDSHGPDGRSRAGDYRAGYVEPMPTWPLARAVAASSCFPPVFDPLRAGVAAEELRGGDYHERDRAELVEGIRLSDGGVYDNLGLEPVWKDHGVVLVSDGGAVFRPKKLLGLLWRADRYTSVVERQSRGVRKRWLISSFMEHELDGTYWGIGTPAEHYTEGSKGYGEDVVDALASVRTDLDAFSEAEIKTLENHGYLLADAAVRRHVPDLIRIDAELQVPYPEWLDEARVRRALRDSGKRKLLGRYA